VAKASELRQLDDEELEGRLSEYRRELMNLRFQLATGQLDNTARLGQVRRDIARVLTVLRAREIEAAEAAGRPAPAPALARAARRPIQSPTVRPQARSEQAEAEEAAGRADKVVSLEEHDERGNEDGNEEGAG
jgi:large subunit ribosomal protein L29